MDKLTLYHGSNQLFDAVDLLKSKDNRDFGRGFYTTTFREQAESWANNMYLRYGGSGQYVYTFELKLYKELKIRIFDGLCIEWLDFVKENRMKGDIQHKNDVVRGPVANDNTFRTVSGYVSGLYTANEALERLKYFKVNDQVSIHTDKALSYLTLIGRRELG